MKSKDQIKAEKNVLKILDKLTHGKKIKKGKKG